MRDKRGIEIVRTYADDGKSGLSTDDNEADALAILHWAIDTQEVA